MKNREGKSEEFNELKKKLQILTKENEDLRSKIENLQNSKTLISLPFENILIHKNGICQEIGESVSKLIGYTREEVIGKNVIDLCVTDEYKSLINEFLKLDYVKPSRIDLRKKNGDIIKVEIEARVSSDLNGKSRIVAIRDVTEQYQAEILIQQNEFFFRTVFENAKIGVCTVSSEGKFIKVNHSLCKLLGYREDELLQKTFNEVTLEEDRNKGIVLQKRMISGEISSFELEKRYIHKDGQIIWASLSTGIMREPASGKNYFITFVNNITSRKLAEQELLKSEERYRSLFETSQDCILIVDRETGRIIDVNQASCVLYGYSKEEFLTMNAFDVSAEPDKSREIINSSSNYVPIRYHRKKDGTSFAVEIVCSYFSQNGQNFVTAFCRDLTNKISIENALRTSEAKLTDSMKMARLGHWEYDFNENKFLFNDNVYSILHTTAAEMGGYLVNYEEYLRRFVPDNEVPLISAELRKAYSNNTNSSRKFDHRFKYADGGMGYMAVNFYVIKDEQGKLVRSFGINQDITERKLTEKALAESREILAHITDSIEDVIYSIDGATGEFDYLSPAFERKFGYTMNDIIEMGGRWPFLCNIIQQANLDTDHVKTKLQKSRVEKTPIWERWWRCKDGSFLFIEDRSVPTYDGNRLIRIDGVLRDVTEQKKAADALAEEQALLRIIVDNIPVALYIKDNQARKILSNAMDLKYIGKTESEVIGKSDEDLLVSESAARTMADDMEVLKKGITVTKEEFLENQLGKYYWFFTTKIPRRNSEGEIIGILGMGMDITERKKAEDEKLESEEKFTHAFKFAPFAMAILDGTGKFVQVNPSFCSLFGYNQDELLTKTFNEITYSEDIQKGIEPVRDLYAGKVDHFGLEKRYVHKNGSVIWAFLSVSVVRNKDGKMMFTIAQIQDITEQKEYELELKNREELLKNQNEELLKAKEKAEESDRLKSAFLANMSHEIRTPMNAIIGFTEFLLKANISDEKKVRFSTLIKERTLDLLRILEDILDISKIEVGQMKVVETEASIPELMKELYDYYCFKKTAIKKNILIRIEIEKGLNNVKIKTDGGRLKQILNNLLDNAFKFTQKGAIEFGCKVNMDADLLFYVKDTGIGIPQEKQMIIFDRFRQAEESFISKSYGGTGLGLSIAKGLVQLMNGKIWLESAVGTGTTFYFTLPFIPIPTNEPDYIESIKTKDSSWKGKSVLIVEDDKTNMEYLEEVLKESNVIIIKATNGKEVLEQLEQYPSIDIVLMDIRLPDTNGLELTRKLKRSNPQLIVLAQTAYASQDDIRECLNAGCDDVITKPIYPDKLVSILALYLNKK